MDFLKKNIVALVAIVIAASAVLGFHLNLGPQALGSTSCSGITCLSGGLRLVSDAGGDFESDVAALFASTVGITGVATFNGGATVTTTNAATSTTSLGCIQTTATSTATPIRLQFGTGNSISTTTSRSSSAAATGGVVYWLFGTCP